MDRPKIGDLVPFKADELGDPQKIGLVMVKQVEDAEEYGEPGEEFLVIGPILRRYWFPEADDEPLRIDSMDVWTTHDYAMWASDLLPKRQIVQEEW
jgi:hypothetical protein